VAIGAHQQNCPQSSIIFYSSRFTTTMCKQTGLKPGADIAFAKGREGADNGEQFYNGVWGRSHQRGLGAESQVGNRRQNSPEVHFHTKEAPKVKDISDSWSVCPRHSASCSHDQPMINGGGRPVVLAWIRPCLKRYILTE